MHLEAVRERIARAAERAGRRPEDISIVAVTKTHPAAVVLEAQANGLLDVGENKVQEALDKQRALADAGTRGLRWHLIGHLQRNKAKQAVGRFALIHSLDSIRLADALEKEAAAKNLRQDVLIQVNVAGEEQKSGVAPAELDALVEHSLRQPHLSLKGFMTMAPFTTDDRTVRRTFRGLRELATSYQLPATSLSMGMSGDFEIAVEEGATMLRLGTVLFGERRP
jgi:pyridoxal phosphate enzyme (YggS family)